MRDAWYETSHLLDRRQSFNGCADERAKNYKNQPLEMKFNDNFTGTLAQYGLNADRWKEEGKDDVRPKAAIIREKGTNGEREMAYSLWLAGFDVKDVMMTDLITGRETLFLFNPKAKEALDKFYAREDTLSLGICNGCQLMVELGLVDKSSDTDNTATKTRMLHNTSHKFESAFLTLNIPQNDSVMFGSLSGNKLGIWVAHGEGKFSLPKAENEYNIRRPSSRNDATPRACYLPLAECMVSA